MGGGGVNATPRPTRFALRKEIWYTWAPGQAWTGAENLAPTGIRSPDRPARSESLYRLSYTGPSVALKTQIIIRCFYYTIFHRIKFEFY